MAPNPKQGKKTGIHGFSSTGNKQKVTKLTAPKKNQNPKTGQQTLANMAADQFEAEVYSQRVTRCVEDIANLDILVEESQSPGQEGTRSLG